MGLRQPSSFSTGSWKGSSTSPSDSQLWGSSGELMLHAADEAGLDVPEMSTVTSLAVIL